MSKVGMALSGSGGCSMHGRSQALEACHSPSVHRSVPVPTAGSKQVNEQFDPDGAGTVQSPTTEISAFNSVGGRAHMSGQGPSVRNLFSSQSSVPDPAAHVTSHWSPDSSGALHS